MLFIKIKENLINTNTKIKNYKIENSRLISSYVL